MNKHTFTFLHVIGLAEQAHTTNQPNEPNIEPNLHRGYCTKILQIYRAQFDGRTGGHLNALQHTFNSIYYIAAANGSTVVVVVRAQRKTFAPIDI